ncbi:hypothetical protein OIC43_30495 [Streptomyces sp. NBC_00825]|uniref:DUF397 domain-containing protein n=1 Tax=Streptomyces sanglieri TaxID=193460 RepID=A0ABW2X5X3_9ACTN|nr:MULTISPECIES: hypothetical protein [unclassified Streptomyces]WTB54057.1 hypothetical protein OG832_13180 [Streptomyces sp. NBC_00826]WTH93053.1 hypothetical protein OIC43_30495 [Streptomyces sp. NBC_00825]WTI01785.1 hypothetical protein OHA23_30475 [Streptomyces sp. NBC_00822]MCX4867405.1 hypothetical protein [Streptomyces sp. NBC_00906]MCX4898643.1 hypothetical protein [Streptomyces sp. NBC_00892]
MTTSGLPRRNPGASGRTYTPPEPQWGAPSRALRVRAADGWERFMRRVEARQEPEE